ncbi:histidine acid phosphatase [Teladorsagia circumcincta]|uniref:acid phosphatase n=1 Tax=Teladorsagia circumcincta TaxID=45464 RepID=A0A2G9V2B7_TELCI|nr:histidine acid phosphatase [Teladorsagia circumcincta]
MKSAKSKKRRKKSKGKSKRKKGGASSEPGRKRRRIIAAIIIVLIAIVLLALAVGGPIYVLFYTKKDREGVKLITSIVLFRHGARAPVDLERNATTEALFPNGAGQLTQFYFKSKANDRCLMSGALVASGMWADPDDIKYTAVPIFSQEKGDRILTHLQNCELEAKRLSQRCGLTPPSPKKWSLYEGFVFECIGLKKTTKLFKDAKDYSRVDGLIQQTYNFIVGTGDYHDKEKLQLKQGLLMKQVLNILKKRWKDWDNNLEIPNPKFIAYSTQDWMVMAFLDALGCGKVALGGVIPGYNSLVVIELIDRDGDPFIWVYFKDNSMDSLRDLTKAVRGCNSSPCPLEKFLKCCHDYVTDDPKTVCGQQS